MVGGRAGARSPPIACVGTCHVTSRPVRCAAAHAQASRDFSPFDTRKGQGLQLVVLADRGAGGAAASSLFSGGLIAFYTVFVLGIGVCVYILSEYRNPSPMDPDAARKRHTGWPVRTTCR